MITTFQRSKLSSNALHGHIIKQSRNLTLIADEDDFKFDGFRIIRNKDITKSYSSDSNEYCYKIMKKEGDWITKYPKGLKLLNISNWQSAFNGIKAEVVIVEDEKRELFIIGPIVKVTKDCVVIHHFNAVGEWEDEENIKLSNITSVRFMDRYSSTHAKYLKWSE